MLRSTGGKALLLTILALAAGCEGSTGPEPAPASVAPSRHPGNFNRAGGEATAGVVVLDASGNPAAGVPVRWEVVAGGGSVLESTTVTDTSGQAYASWRLGATKGVEQRIRATVAGLPPVEFTTTVKDFFFWVISPPSPGPGAVVSGPALNVQAYTEPYHPVGESYMVSELTLTVGDRTAAFGPAAGPARWMASLSLAGLAPGTHTYHVHATDIHGNTHDESVTFTYAP